MANKHKSNKGLITLGVICLLFIAAIFLRNKFVNRAPISINQIGGDNSTFSVFNNNSDPSDWLDLNENQVFFRRLEHSQPNNEWTIKIGKGGQIYSIKTPEIGEMISYQRAHSGQWVDEVFQHVIPSSIQKNSTTCDTVDGDIHQAGFYQKSDLDCTEPYTDIIPQSVYSPLFNFRHNQSENSVSYTTWPQHAHLPRTYTDNGMLMHQTITDLGDGVVEINVKIDKWSGADTSSLTLPHSPWRQDNLPYTLLSQPDGSYAEYEVSSRFDAKSVRLRDQSTNGWLALAKGKSDSSRGIGIVFGKSLSSVERDLSLINIRAPDDFMASTGHSTTVVSFNRQVDLQPGDSFSIRYYLVFGTLAKIKKYGNQLQSQVVLTKTSPTLDPNNISRIAICTDDQTELRRGCQEGEQPLFYTLRDFTKDAKPLFLLKQNSTGQYRITTNPYEISKDPTDGKTDYVNFLGWSIPQSTIPPNNQQFKRLDNLVDQQLFSPNSPAQKTLMVIIK